MAGRAMSLAGLHVVAGEDAEAARVDAERLVEAVFGAEVGDRAVERVAVAALEPVVRAVGHVAVEVGQDVVVLGQELGVVEQARPVGRTADDRDRVAVARPGRPVDRRSTGRACADATPSGGCRRGVGGLRAGAGAGSSQPGCEGTRTGSMRRHHTRSRCDVNRFSDVASCAAGPHVARRAARTMPRCDADARRDARRPNASRGPRPAAWPTSSTPSRGRSAELDGAELETPVDVFLPRYRGGARARRRVERDAGLARARTRGRRRASAPVTVLDVPGGRLSAAPGRPSGRLRSRRLLRRRRRRLRRQRLAVRAVLPGGAGGAARRRAAARRPPSARLAHRAGGHLPRRPLRRRPDHRRGGDPA